MFNPLQVHYSRRDSCETCGSNDLDKTRSSLLVEWLRIIRGVRPDFGIYENVKNIVQKKFKETTFKLFEEELHEYGYHTYWKVLNAKDYGIPQNRERVFLILIKKELDNGKFEFPEPFETDIRLKDLLEDTVEEKYYMSQEKVKRLIEDMKGRKALLFEPDEKVLSIWENRLYQMGQIETGRSWDNPQSGRIYAPEGCCPAITCGTGGHTVPKIVKLGKVGVYHTNEIISAEGIAPTQMAAHDQMKIASLVINGAESRKLYAVNEKDIILVRQATKKGYEECIAKGVANLTYPSCDHKRGRVQQNGTICPTLTAQTNGVYRLESLLRIRRITPKECFRLMGFWDSDFDKVAEAGMSDSQMYKQAGNSIVVNVLYHIYLKLYEAMPYLFEDMKLGSFFSGIGAFEKALDRFYETISGRES